MYLLLCLFAFLSRYLILLVEVEGEEVIVLLHHIGSIGMVSLEDTAQFDALLVELTRLGLRNILGWLLEEHTHRIIVFWMWIFVLLDLWDWLTQLVDLIESHLL